MAVTLQQIADLAGVSRRTVDRALNNKGRVKAEVAEKIKKIAKDLDYQPSKAGRALVMAKRNLKIGVILQSAKTPFMQDVLKGLMDAKKEVQSLGATVDIKTIDEVDTVEVINLMNEMYANGINGIALSPSEDKHLAKTINQFVHEYNIPVATFNSDLEETDRLCFVGQNSFKAGQTAAGLMAALTNKQGKIVIFCGHKDNPALINRIDGFSQEVKNSYPNMELVDLRYYYDDNLVAEKLVDDILKQYPDTSGFYVTGRAEGICKALTKNHKLQELKVVAHDLIQENINLLEHDGIDFLIGQNAYGQGYKAVLILFKKVLDGSNPQNKLQYTEIVIKNKYNIQ